jgi:diguanylate cyclase (GGDEF)-like protein/PAS domain S-box-containing protein
MWPFASISRVTRLFRTFSSDLRMEVLRVVIVSAIALAIVIQFELFEALVALTRAHENWEVDEFLSLFVIGTIAFGYLARRRWQDMNHQTRKRARAERELLESEHRLRVLFNGSPSALVAINESTGAIVEVNPEFERLSGFARREILGLSLGAIRLLESPELEARLTRGVVSEEQRSVETALRSRSGGEHIVLMSLDRVILGAEKVILISFHDISERKKLERELTHQALHDSLTGLPNRVLLLDRITQAVARTRRRRSTVSVLFIDLDDFKIVNDTMGHEAGDELLRQVAIRLGAPLRASDTCARIGGDEFAILIEDEGSDGSAQLVSERILNSLRDTFEIAGKCVYVGASIGISTTDQEGDAGELMRRADLAMYVAKTGGKHRAAMFEPSMHATLINRSELTQQLRGAVDRGEFSMAYQPIVVLDSQEITGFEALLRWQHPSRGILPPVEFIALAEQVGVIVEMGTWIRKTACLACASWPPLADGRYLSVTVNVSARELREPDFVDGLRRTLVETGLSPQRLVLEMTENVLVANDTITLQRLRDLKKVGVQLAIDDFGTGYSSLSYLHQFPVDIIKIDKSFIDHLGEAGMESPLSRAVVSLGSVLSIRTVAEGVETEDQFRRLKELGCPLGQGYLFARPMPGEAIAALLAERAGRPEHETDEVFERSLASMA